MKRSIIFTAALTAALFLAVPAFAQSGAGFPRIEPQAAAVDFFQRGLDGGFSWTDLAEISVWASGGNAAAVQRILDVQGAIAASPDLPQGRRELADFILLYLHSNVFRAYSLDQSRVDTVFANGRFNCVSSAVLYIILAQAFGIEAYGVVTKDHAFVMVRIDGEYIDVETTSAFGFDPGGRREFHDDFGRITGFVYVPAGNYHDRQTISAIELVSVIMTNHIANLEAASRFAEAVPIAVDRSALLTGVGAQAVSPFRHVSGGSFFDDPRRDKMNRLFNLGAFLLNSRREEEALRWAAFASPRYPCPEGRWQELVLASVNNRVMRFVAANQIGQARTFLNSHEADLTAASFAHLDVMLLDNELVSRANGIRTAGDGGAVISDIELALGTGRIAAGRGGEILNFAIQRTASVIGGAGGWLTAINFIEDAQARFGSNADLDRALQTFRQNRVTDFHNRFATEWNRGNLDEARRILDEGLAEFPANSQLQSNREAVERALR
ncbi:MAG: hypothetical protein FWG66_07380 [Spirochaetes bacterium]|nr:hypothetical protein [Spirochaetota bacterium]